MPVHQALATVDQALFVQAHEDFDDRVPGGLQGDFTGVPMNDAARRYADAFNVTRVTVLEHQCQPYNVAHIYRGPLQFRIWEEKDPGTQTTIAYQQYLGTYQQYRTIWMDGRPHPPAHAPHTWMGFSTGRWAGDRLVVETTHIKQGWHRRNGVPQSDQTTLTEHFVKHGNQFTHIAVIRDPVYLTEPLVKTNGFLLSPNGTMTPYPCEAVVEIVRPPGYVPHYLPGKNPYMAEYRAEVHLDVPGAGGAPGTAITPTLGSQPQSTFCEYEWPWRGQTREM